MPSGPTVNSWTVWSEYFSPIRREAANPGCPFALTGSSRQSVPAARKTYGSDSKAARTGSIAR
jgi:hypothetical protein